MAKLHAPAGRHERHQDGSRKGLFLSLEATAVGFGAKGGFSPVRARDFCRLCYPNLLQFVIIKNLR
jgi:hypothetical protein